MDRATDRGSVSRDTAPRYLLRDRDGIYGHEFTSRVDHMGIKQVKTAPPDHGKVVEIRMVGGLHHRYRRLAA